MLKQKSFTSASATTIKETFASRINSLDSQKRIEVSLEKVLPLIMNEIDISEASTLTSEELSNHIRPIIGKIMNEEKIQLNSKEQELLEKRLIDDMIGLGPLESLLADDSIDDILVNGCKSIYIEKHGKLSKSTVSFRNDTHIMNVIQRILTVIGRRVDETTPYVDARLEDGSRVNAIIPPLALDGPCISIRKFRKKTINLQHMVKNNSVSQQMADFLEIAIKCRQNIIILGGTGSGKTTLLNALSNFIPEDERIITIEDSAELQLQQPHVIRLETRIANVEGKGSISERQLVRNTLRMRPNRIILGEIRGEEAFDMLQAMNTGHDGSLCTIHASNTEEVPARLTNMIMMAGYRFPLESIENQIGNSINLLVEVSRMQDGKRRIVNISEVYSVNKKITIHELFKFKIEKTDSDGNIFGNYTNISTETKLKQAAINYNYIKQLNECFKR